MGWTVLERQALGSAVARLSSRCRDPKGGALSIITMEENLPIIDKRQRRSLGNNIQKL